MTAWGVGLGLATDKGRGNERGAELKKAMEQIRWLENLRVFGFLFLKEKERSGDGPAWPFARNRGPDFEKGGAAVSVKPNSRNSPKRKPKQE